MYKKELIAFVFGLILLPSIFFGANSVLAQSELQKLQQDIAEKNSRLDSIQKEIAEFESALLEVGAEKNTLQRAINQLELERKKIQADIRYTENKIESTDLTIDRLLYEIINAEDSIITNEKTIAQVLKQMNIDDNESMVELMLRYDNISEFWNSLEELESFRLSVGDKVTELVALKEQLESNKQLNEKTRDQLLDLKSQYSDQQSILTSNRTQKAELLSATQNEEEEYQKLLRDKQAARDLLLSEVRDIESQIKFILDPNSIPSKGSAVFIWPLDNVIITQNFGYTQFALSGAYNGNQHNGMDMGAPVGTRIKAPLTGTVRNIGNTDAVPGCYSWGKWLLIDHPNGLSTMFAHLSQIAVSPGQKVNTGDIVGYVGNTGYSTGPHLHHTLYVTAGVQVMAFNQFKSVTGCGAALSPFAGIEAYLNPRDYLPPL